VTHEELQDQRMLEWLESGPWDVPAEPLEAAVAYARTHPRRRLPGAGLWRLVMSQVHLTEVQPPKAHRNWAAVLGVAAVVVVMVAVVGGVGLFNRNQRDQGGGIVAPPASSTTAPTVAPTTAPTTAPVMPPPTAMVGDSACVVATLAGKASSPGAADGTGADARFSQQFGTGAIDAAGVLYLVDAGNHAIRKVTPDGVVTTYAGKLGEAGSVDGDRSSARFNDPVAVALGPGGELYVADDEDQTIRKIAPDGTVTTLAGKAGEAGRVNGVGEAARFDGPWSIAVDAAGTVYVGEQDGHTIRTITPGGSVTTLAGEPGRYGWVDGVGAEARLYFPFGMAVGPDGLLYVADVNANRSASVLRTVSPDGTVTTIDADWTAGQPAKVWVDPSGVVYATAFLNGTVLRMTPDGTVTLLAGQKDAPPPYRDGTGDVARFGGPLGILGNASGVLYVADTESATLRTVTCP
jgi:sugar lactone lactonase YvrE